MLAGYFLTPSSSLNNLFAYPLLLALCIKGPQWRRLKPLFQNRIFLISSLFLGYLWLTTFWSDTDERLKEVLDNLRYGAMILSFLGSLFFLNRRHESYLDTFLQAIVIAATCSALLGLYWHLQEHAFLHQRLNGPGRLENAVVAGFGYGMSALLALYLTFSQNKKFVFRVMYAACFSILVIALLSTHTRSAMLGFAVSAVILAPFLAPSTKKRYQWLGAAAVILVVALMVYLNWVTILRTLAAQNERIEIWLYVLNKVQLQPWFGYGIATDDKVPGTKYIYNHPHSAYVATLFYGGIVGLVLLLTTLITSAWVSLKQIPKQFAAFSLSVLCYSGITMGLDGYQILDKISYIWIIFWLPVGIAMVLADKGKTKAA